MTVQAEIRKAAIDRGLSLRQLAARAEMKPTYFGYRIRGQRDFTTRDLFKLSEALEMPAWELMKRAETNNC